MLEMRTFESSALDPSVSRLCQPSWKHLPQDLHYAIVIGAWVQGDLQRLLIETSFKILKCYEK